MSSIHSINLLIPENKKKKENLLKKNLNLRYRLESYGIQKENFI